MIRLKFLIFKLPAGSLGARRGRRGFGVFKGLKTKNYGLKNVRPEAQAGVVALISTIIVGLLLTVVTTSAVAVVIKELRQAIDTDLSTRAYYAAETGVEDAILSIKNTVEAGGTVTDKTTCGPPVAVGSGSDQFYTCQLIQRNTNRVEQFLPAENSAEIDFSARPIDRVIIAWNQRASVVGPNTDARLTAGTSIPAGFPPAYAWDPARHPAVMELAAISYPSGGSFNTGEIINQEVIMKPANSSTTTPAVILGGPLPVIANCDPNVAEGDYNCRAEISNFAPSRNYILRLKARYGPAHFIVEGYSGFNPVTVADETITIDVTGRSGDVFRRIVTRANIGSRQAGSGLEILDYVLFSDLDICKNFEITPLSNRASQEDGCEGIAF